MRTTEKVSSSSSKSSLPPGCALPQLKTLLPTQATRNVGQALDNIPGIAELIEAACEKDEFKSLHDRLAIPIPDGSDLSCMPVSGIIELTRLETEPGEQALEHFNIVAVLQDVAQATRAAIGQKPVTVMDVSSSGPVIILSNPCKIGLLMKGLGDHAAKFTERGRIALILNKDENAVRLMVTDTGRGMTSEEIAAVFDTADREYDSQAPGYSESGLGLRIVKHLVKSLGGSISVSSRVGEGTIVEVSLPLMNGLQETPRFRRSGGCVG